MLKEHIEFIDNKAIQNTADNYVNVVVNVPEVLESWKLSLFSFEWLSPEGTIKTLEDLPEKERPKRQTVEEKLQDGQPIEKPVLGIGTQDNVEIGIGRAEFLTLAAGGLTQIPVHIPKSHESDFQGFLAET